MKFTDYVEAIKKTQFASKLNEKQLDSFVKIVRRVIKPCGYAQNLCYDFIYLIKYYHIEPHVDFKNYEAVNASFQAYVKRKTVSSKKRYAIIYNLLENVDLTALGSTNYLEFVCRMPIEEILDLFIKKDKSWNYCYNNICKPFSFDCYELIDFSGIKLFFDKIVVIALASCFSTCDITLTSANNISIIETYCFEYNLSWLTRKTNETFDDIYKRISRIPIAQKPHVKENLKQYVELVYEQGKAITYAKKSKNVDIAVMLAIKFTGKIHPMLMIGCSMIDSFVNIRLSHQHQVLDQIDIYSNLTDKRSNLTDKQSEHNLCVIEV
jgi:hypothetical protein